MLILVIQVQLLYDVPCHAMSNMICHVTPYGSIWYRYRYYITSHVTPYGSIWYRYRYYIHALSCHAVI